MAYKSNVKDKSMQNQLIEKNLLNNPSNQNQDYGGIEKHPFDQGEQEEYKPRHYHYAKELGIPQNALKQEEMQKKQWEQEAIKEYQERKRQEEVNEIIRQKAREEKMMKSMPEKPKQQNFMNEDEPLSQDPQSFQPGIGPHACTSQSSLDPTHVQPPQNGVKKQREN